MTAVLRILREELRKTADCGGPQTDKDVAAVVSEALAVLNGDRGPGMVTFGYSDDEAFAVGLTCGGTIRLFIEEFNW